MKTRHASLLCWVLLGTTQGGAQSYSPAVVYPCDPGSSCDITTSDHPTQSLTTTPPYGTRSVQAAFGSRFPQRPYAAATGTISLFKGHSNAAAIDPKWALSPFYDSDVHVDPFTGTPPEQSSPDSYGIDSFDCSSSSDTSDWPIARPNQFDAVTIQGVYEDALWPEGEKENAFAKRSIFLTGTSSAAVANLESGGGNTMPQVGTDSSRYLHAKYAVGTLSQGVLTKGGRITRQSIGELTGDLGDVMVAVGAANLGSTAFDSATTNEFLWKVTEDKPAGTQTPPIFAYIRGSDNVAAVGGRISSSNSSGKLVSGLDARALGIHESDKWKPGVAIVPHMIGATGTCFLDMRRNGNIPVWDTVNGVGYMGGPPAPTSADLTPGAGDGGEGAYAGYIGKASCFYATAGAAVEGSYFNVREVVLFDGSFIFGDFYDRINSADACDDASQRCDGLVRSYVFANATAPEGWNPQAESMITCNGPAIMNSIGIRAEDQMPNSGGGSPIQNAELVRGRATVEQQGNTAVSSEKRASIVACGNVVLGDGTGSSTEQETTGYGTDVVHVRDLLHLAPRTVPPAISSSVPASDRAGLIYMDAANGTLRVSIPFRGTGDTGSTPWKSDGIVWVNVALETDKIRPEDIVLNDEDSQVAMQLYDSLQHPGTGGPAYQAYIEQGLENARQEAAQAPVTSPYIAPSVAVLSHEMIGEGVVLVDLRVTGMRRAYTGTATPPPPEVHYQTRVFQSFTIEKVSHWSLAQDVARLSSPPGGGESAPGDAYFSVALDLGATFANGTVYLMVIDSENSQCSGASFVIRGTVNE